MNTPISEVVITMANEKLNDFISSAKKATKKAANTTLELADIATLNVKLQAHNVKLSEKFEKLGRLSYAKLADDADNAEKIAACVAEIDKIKNAIEDINAEIKAKKDSRKKKKCEEKKPYADTCEEPDEKSE